MARQGCPEPPKTSGGLLSQLLCFLFGGGTPTYKGNVQPVAKACGVPGFPSAGLLLRAHHAPSASSVRRVLHHVDNHLRPYTGKHVVRRGWRMQDKRVRPGITDY